MTLGFVFDTKLKKYKENYYSTNLPAEFLTSRYLRNFDELVIICRYEQVSEHMVEKYLQSNSEKIRVKAIKSENPLKRIINFKKDSDYIREVLKECDAVVCRGWRGTSISSQLGKPYLVEVVNCVWDAYWNHGIMGKMVAPIMYVLRKISVKEAPYVLYVTREFLQKRYPTKGYDIGISDVQLEDFDDRLLNKRINKIRNKKNTGKIIIGTAAAVDVPYKGHKYVISALSKLKKMGYLNYEYQIAGSGDQNRLREYAKKCGVENQICFLGNIPHDKIFEWFDSIDIYIQPSLQEGLPRALLEAMSRGILCYGAKTGGIPELLPQECVCKNNYFLKKYIVKFILQYSEDVAIKNAIRNIEESKKYSKNLLNEKWQQYFENFYRNSLR